MHNLLTFDGKRFCCSCGCCIFNKSNLNGLWICNNCKSIYADETYDGPIGKTCNICIYKEYPYLKMPCLRCIKNAKMEKYDKSNILNKEDND